MTFSKQTEKAIAALQKAEKSPAWNRVAAYVILAPMRAGHKINYGKIKVLYPAAGEGPLKVFVWDCTYHDVQMGQASGYGYDKLSAALQGIKFDDIVFTDHPNNWEIQLREAGYTVIQAI